MTYSPSALRFFYATSVATGLVLIAQGVELLANGLALYPSLLCAAGLVFTFGVEYMLKGSLVRWFIPVVASLAGLVVGVPLALATMVWAGVVPQETYQVDQLRLAFLLLVWTLAYLVAGYRRHHYITEDSSLDAPGPVDPSLPPRG